MLMIYFLQLHRQRYWKFDKVAIQRELPSLPEPSVVAEIKSRRPLFFEITDRLSAVHKGVFASSTVRHVRLKSQVQN